MLPTSKKREKLGRYQNGSQRETDHNRVTRPPGYFGE
jgi:hypothetical protein